LKPLPIGTRTIRVAMFMTRNYSYVDDISLKLVGDGAAVAAPFVRITNPGGDAGNTTGWTEEYDTAYFQSPTLPPADVVAVGACDEFSCYRDASVASDAMSQVVDMPSAFNASIDAGARRLDLAWLEKVWSQDSRVTMEVSFLDAGNLQVGVTGNSPQARSINVWNSKAYSLDVPVNARKFRLRVRFLTGVAPRDYNKTFATGFTARLVGRLASPGGVKLLTSVDGPLPLPAVDKVLYAYNSNGSLISVTDEVGLVTSITALTANGLPATIVGPKLAADAASVTTTTTLAYDARDRLTTVIVNPGASQAQTTIAYDAIGQITRITQPDGSYLDYVWSDARRLTSVTNNTGEKIEYGYNANGDVTSSTIKSSSSVITKQMTMAYDELGRLLRSIGAATQTTTFSYDRTDLNVQVKDPRNNLYGYSYDALSRLVHRMDQAGGEVRVTRNAQDAITSYKDDRLITTTYVRNGFGEVMQEVSPDAGTTTYVRDERGLVTVETDGRGIVTNRTYDAAGRLLTETYPAATTENVTYTYDNVTTPAGNKGRGKLTKITDQSGSTAYVYNALGQIMTDTRVIAARTYVTSYTYNAAGNVTQITYPSGRIVSITRNTLGQVTGVTTKQNATAAVVNVAAGMTYAPMSNLLTAMTHGNGLVTTAGYDLDYRLTSLTLKDGATNVSALAYAYTDGMNLTGITDSVTPANSNTLGYSLANPPECRQWGLGHEQLHL
jgi:YD repeat-containing protein